MALRTALKSLLGLVVGLPLLQALLFWVGGLLAAMGDAAAANVLRGVNIAVGVLWLISLLAIVVLLAVKAVSEPVDVIDERDETL
jgi:hypothetical protein